MSSSNFHISLFMKFTRRMGTSWCCQSFTAPETASRRVSSKRPASTRLAGLALFVIVFAASSSFPVAAAADFPVRPIRLVVGFAPGGTTDFMARLLADKLRGPLGRTVVVENRTGANGALGAEFVAKSEPDGYTLYFTTAGVAVVYPHLRSGGVGYDTVADFAPVGLVAFNSTMLVVNAAMAVNSAADLAELARRNPSRVTLAITGLGSVSHLGVELFQAAAGVKFLAVPYRGASPAVADLLGGQLDGLFGDVPTVIAQIEAHRIKALAAMSAHRSEVFPDVPTFVEQGFADTVADQWAGVLAPAHTPAEIVDKLNVAIVTAMNDGEVRAKLAKTGTVPSPDTPAHFARYLRDEYARWGTIIRDKGLKAE
jgi:tripartite-type tricarboxylate transporter receptor subunit TctC